MKASQYLKACRDRLGVESNYALAHRWGVSQAALSKYENGHRLPDLRTRLLIAKTLDLPLEAVATDPDLEWPTARKSARGAISKFLALALAIVSLCLMAGASTDSYASGNMHRVTGLSNTPHSTNYAPFLRRLRKLWQHVKEKITGHPVVHRPQPAHRFHPRDFVPV